MFSIANAIGAFSGEEKRQIAYYLIRYFKGAPHLEKAGKDFYADVLDGLADDRIRAATEKAIKYIEGHLQKRAIDFDEATTNKVLGIIADFEDEVSEDFSEAQLSEADSFLRRAAGSRPSTP